MRQTFWKVGELARETGISIRTLHYYDEIGLLRPSHKSSAGHRHYAAPDIEKLQIIRSLRQLGFPLNEISGFLDRPGWSPLEVIRLHLARIREQIEVQQQLCRKLEAIAGVLDRAQTVSAEEFIGTMEAMTMFEKYFSKEQLEELKERGAVVGEDRIREVEAEWPRLIAEVRAEMDKGTDPSDAKVQDLARRWAGLVNEFTGGNPEIARSVATMYRQEPDVSAKTGIDSAMSEYISKAAASSKK
jgi:DNA-binding transcriptional MerR regulator